MPYHVNRLSPSKMPAVKKLKSTENLNSERLGKYKDEKIYTVVRRGYLCQDIYQWAYQKYFVS
jgi:hypothetical protein